MLIVLIITKVLYLAELSYYNLEINSALFWAKANIHTLYDNTVASKLK